MGANKRLLYRLCQPQDTAGGANQRRRTAYFSLYFNDLLKWNIVVKIGFFSAGFDRFTKVTTAVTRC